METRHSVEGQFVSQFPAICNHCGVMAAWNRKTLKNYIIFSVFCVKIMFRKLSSQHWSTLCVQISWNRPLFDGKSCVAYLNKKNFVCLSNCRYCADRAHHVPGSAPTVYSECSGFHPNRFTVGGGITERVNTAKSRPKVIPIFALKHCFEANNKLMVCRMCSLEGQYYAVHTDRRKCTLVASRAAPWCVTLSMRHVLY